MAVSLMLDIKGLRMNYFIGNSLWRLVSQSDAVSKGVLLILLLLSIVCWAIFLFKIIVLRLKCKQLAQTHAQLESVRTVDQLLTIASLHQSTIAGYYLMRIMIFLKVILESSEKKSQTSILQESEWDVLQRHIAQAIDLVMSYEESYVSW